MPSKYEAVWAPEPFWTFGGEKNLLSLPKPEPGIFQSVTYYLYRLRYPDSLSRGRRKALNFFVNSVIPAHSLKRRLSVKKLDRFVALDLMFVNFLFLKIGFRPFDTIMTHVVSDGISLTLMTLQTSLIKKCILINFIYALLYAVCLCII